MVKKSTSKNLKEKPFPLINNVLDKIPNLQNFKSSKKFYVILLIVGVLLLAMLKKDWFIAALVNGSPITNLELQMKLNQQFRTQTLNQMINEKIILDEAAKNNATPTEAEINNKISELEKSVGGTQVFDSLLSQQGQNRDSIRSQIKVQLSIEKLYLNEATISAQEVEQFLSNNKDQLQATDSAGQIKEVENILKQQKLSQIFNQKFQELRQKAKIQIF
ncbi:SurA N-terminal domain-containing protein [Candidatus Microgenomates bacterium]|nr:SurA N-terminal domain-containing protein [Candidatus Microgenomates bacterium]